MDENTTNGGGASTDHESGAPVENSGDNTSGDRGDGRDPGLERALQDLHKFKNENRQLKERLSNFEKQLQDQTAKTLREKEDWKTLYEQADKELKTFVQDVAVDKKKTAVLNAALKAGLINDRDIDFFPLEEVKVDMTTRGKWLVEGVEDIIESQKKLRPYLFRETKPPVFNPGGSNAPAKTGTFTAEDLVAVEKKHGRNSQEFKQAWQKFREAKLAVKK